MGDISKVEFYKYEELGYIVDPESDKKEVFIPSPPTYTTVKINPRAAVIWVTGGKVTSDYEKLDELKAYCADNKVMFICPETTDAEELGETYEYVQKHAKSLNIKMSELVVKGDAAHMNDAIEANDYFIDELDADLEDAEEFDI